MKKTEIEAILGRPLTPIETENYKLYFEIAKEQLENLLCFSGNQDDKTYIARKGYRSLFTEPFTQIEEILLDGEITTDYKIKQWDSLNADWFNVIEFTEPLKEQEIVVKADWGFENCMPADIKLLLAKIFGLTTKSIADDGRVRSKSIANSFSVTYNNNSLYEQVLKDYANIINKYSICNIAEIQNGSIRTIC